MHSQKEDWQHVPCSDVIKDQILCIDLVCKGTCHFGNGVTSRQGLLLDFFGCPSRELTRRIRMVRNVRVCGLVYEKSWRWIDAEGKNGRWIIGIPKNDQFSRRKLDFGKCVTYTRVWPQPSQLWFCDRSKNRLYRGDG